jgi:oxygen-independent coproporphyrinogen-3 oxidase
MRDARAAGFDNVGLDLIAGLPGLDAARWRETLERACALKPRHLSVYALSVDPGSALEGAVAEGRVSRPGDEAVMDALALAESLLTEAGFERYELSNYAQPGYACRHNLACWRGEDYLGVGPSAASRIGLRRWTHAADLAVYERALAEGCAPPGIRETLTPEDDASERFTTGLRLREGVSPREFAVRYAAAAPRVTAWERALAGLERHGLTRADAAGPYPRWRLTARGCEVADAVMRELL